MRHNGAMVGARTHVQKALRSELSDMQAAFVVAYVVNGANGTAAAREAGYPNDRMDARRLLGSPMILAAIRLEQARVIGAELSTIAIGTLRKVMLDDNARNADRVNASRLALEAARWIGRGMSEDRNTHERPLSELSAAELDAVISDTQRSLASLRQELRTIDGGTPVPTVETASAIPEANTD